MCRWGVLLALCLAAHVVGAAVPAGVEPSVLLPTVGGKPAKEPAIFWQQQGQWFADADDRTFDFEPATDQRDGGQF